MALNGGIPDVIAVINLAMHLYENVIGVAREAKREFGSFSRELINLKSTLEGIRRECGPNGKLTIQSKSADQNKIISDLEEAVEFTKESLNYWNYLLEDFRRRSQTISWKIAWITKYPKLSQCRDKIHLQSKFLEMAMIRMQTSQNSVIIGEMEELKQELKRMISLLPTTPDRPPVAELAVEDQVGDENSEGSLSISSIRDTYEEGSCRSEVLSIIQIIDEKISRFKSPKRSVYCRPQVPENTPSEEIIKKFEESKGNEQEEPSSGAWLRIGTWWLLKSIKLSELLGKDHTAQPYVDLLKSSWILYSILGMGNSELKETQDMIESLLPEELALLENLATVIGNHTNNFKGSSVPDNASLALANFSIWERRPITEELGTGNTYDDPFDPQRWITIDDELAGSDEEEVLCRSFVQAQIGSRKTRRLAEDADYMLILVVRSEETEPTIILSNQTGNINLSCSCSFLQWTNEDPEGSTVRKIDIPFCKTGTPIITLVPITFKSTTDYHKFTSIARKYLKAVGDREPTETENQIFRSILQEYDKNDTNSRRQTRPLYIQNHGPRYWELRVHEGVSDKYWKTVRRLVISDCARAKDPICISFFLPLSWVYVSQNPQNPMEVTMKWSDCNQKDTTSGGSFDEKYTYKWSPNNPNNCIKFTFLDEKSAKDFSKAILSLNTCQVLWQSWSQQNPEYQLSHVSDMNREDGPEHYKALVVTKSENSRSGVKETWKHSEFYFFGKEVDYIIDHDDKIYDDKIYDNQPTIDDDNQSATDEDNQSTDKRQSTIELTRVYSPLYVSTHVDLPQDAITAAEFSHTIAKREKVIITLKTRTQIEELHRQVSPTSSSTTDRPDPSSEAPTTTTEIQEFISALSDSWNVVLSMGHIQIEYTQPSLPLFMTKTKKTQVYLQVWRNGTSERIVARRVSSYSKDSPKWISVQACDSGSIFKEAAGYNKKSSKRSIVIQTCTIWRGTLLDTKKMRATNEKASEPDSLNVERFVIRFMSAAQRHKFNKLIK